MAVETQDQYPQPDGQDLMGAIETFDVARQSFFDATARYVRRPTGGSAEKLSQCVGEVSMMFMQAMGIIVEDARLDSQAKGHMIATLLKGDDEERIGAFSKLLPEHSTSFAEDPNDTEELSEEIAGHIDEGDNDDVLTHIKYHYHHNLEVDLSKLIDFVDDTRKAKVLKYGKLAGKHAFDVAKIGAGVTLGLLATRLVKDR